MKRRVPDAVKQEASRCTRNFSCLESDCCGGREMCVVDYAIGDRILFLVPGQQSRQCAYQTTFGRRLVCSCPVRCHTHANSPGPDKPKA